MALTPAQQATLKAAIIADEALNAQPNNSDGAFAIAAALNALASPAFLVWKSSVPTKDCKTAMIWTEFIARSAGEREAWTFMLSNGVINPSDANVRQGIADIFSGAGGATSRTNLLAISKRNATRAEKIFATGTGSDAVPAVMGREGALSYQDVEDARNS